MRIWATAAAISLLSLCGCDDTLGITAGKEGGPCYENNTCNTGLICASSLCVRLPDAYSCSQSPDAGLDSTVADAASSDILPTDMGGVLPGTWISIPKGYFFMGSPTGETCREPDGDGKETQHKVTLTHPFEMSASEVTQGLFETEMGYNPSFFSTFCGKSCPVEQVTWHDAAAYCNALSKKKGLAYCYLCKGSGSSLSCMNSPAYDGSKTYTCPGYRLPTEAEWEYAYRAGTTSAFYNGAIISCDAADPNADKIGWYFMNASINSHTVGQKAPNKWGLYDMAGNVYEWCHDWSSLDLGSADATDPPGPASGPSKVMRGGAFGSYARSLRAAFRTAHTPEKRFLNIGFRCVRTTSLK